MSMLGWALLAGAGMAAAVAATPSSLQLSPSTAPPLVTVQVSATNAPSGARCSIYLDLTPVGSCTVNDNGELAGSFAVPAGVVAGSDHPVTACAGPCDPAPAAFSRRIFVRRGTLHVAAPALDPLSSPVRAPGSVPVTGSGWSPGGRCRLGAGTVTAGCTVDASGVLTGRLPVTARTPSRRYQLTATNTVPGVV